MQLLTFTNKDDLWSRTFFWLLKFQRWNLPCEIFSSPSVQEHPGTFRLIQVSCMEVPMEYIYRSNQDPQHKAQSPWTRIARGIMVLWFHSVSRGRWPRDSELALALEECGTGKSRSVRLRLVPMHSLAPLLGHLLLHHLHLFLLWLWPRYSSLSPLPSLHPRSLADFSITRLLVPPGPRFFWVFGSRPLRKPRYGPTGLGDQFLSFTQLRWFAILRETAPWFSFCLPCTELVHI